MSDDKPDPPVPRGIVCPRCGNTEWEVRETRPGPGGRVIRIRLCCGCWTRVRTREVIEAVCDERGRYAAGT